MITELNDEYVELHDKKRKVLKVIDRMKQHVMEADNVQDMFTLVKINNEYIRYSTELNSSDLISALEIAKFSVIGRIGEE
tara:strand:+ start:63 stop:302 length:240 start_codon:yes stop_codon:yes gene_type:complete